jgi:hypothetical protein
MQTRDEILAKFATRDTDRITTEIAWDKLVDEEEVAYRELAERFGPRRADLDAKTSEVDFLDHIEIVDGTPIHSEIDRDLHVLRAFASPTTPFRIAMFNTARGHSNLSIHEGEDEVSYFRFDTENLTLARDHALRWLVRGSLPPPAYAITVGELNASAAKPEAIPSPEV